MFKYTTQQN